jgi:hypothetical protein
MSPITNPIIKMLKSIFHQFSKFFIPCNCYDCIILEIENENNNDNESNNNLFIDNEPKNNLFIKNSS